MFSAIPAAPVRRCLAVLLIPVVGLGAACGASTSASVKAAKTAIPARRTSSAAATPVRPGASGQPVPPLPADPALLTLVTKQHGLAADYVPRDLTPLPAAYVSSEAAQRLQRPAAEALLRLLTAAAQDGLQMKVLSAYRSYQEQASVFRQEVAMYGCAQALRESALPGHSEHQLGLAADFTSADVKYDLVEGFAETAEGRWLGAHAAAYGFVLSYPMGKENVTGYQYEPWHYRYVTEPFAAAILASGLTATEYLSALGSPSSMLIVSATPTPVLPPGQCPQV